MTIKENKKLSRNRKRRTTQKINMNNNMKLILNKIKTENKKKYRDINKNKQIEILLVRIKYADKPDTLESASKEINKIQLVDKKLHEIKHKKLRD